MSSLTRIIFRSKGSTLFTRSINAAYRTTTSQYAGRFSSALKTRSHGTLTDNSTTNKSVVPDERNPFIFSRGHWLSHDSARQAARRICFNFPELCRRVVTCCAGASSIASRSKQDGHISRTLVFDTDTGKCIVVRLPTPAAGPAGRVVNSEVATIEYLTSKTDILVPKILEWREDANNTVGHAYLIMEHATGVSLHDIWPKLRRKWRKRCVKAVCQHLAKTTQLRFSAYGSLYCPIQAVYPLPARSISATTFALDLSVVPLSKIYTPETRSSQTAVRGLTWSSLLTALFALGWKTPYLYPRSAVSRPPEQHVDLLNHAHRVLRTAVKDPRVVSESIPTMLHASPTMRHVFVDPRDPRVVTCITGWQACTISPAFSYCDDSDELGLEIPFGDAGEDVNDTFPHEICVERACELYPLFRDCHNTWAQGLPVLEQRLNDCAHDWHRFNLPDSCPYRAFWPTNERYSHWQRDQLIEHHVHRLLGNVKHDFVENDAWSGIPKKLKEVRSDLYKYFYELSGYTREMVDASWPYSTDFD